jgi:hypothetical protein
VVRRYKKLEKDVKIIEEFNIVKSNFCILAILKRSYVENSKTYDRKTPSQHRSII